MPVVVSIIVAVCSLGYVGWFYYQIYNTNQNIQSLQSQNSNLNTQIAADNQVPGGTSGQTVESLSKSLLTEVNQYKAVMDGRMVWGNVLPQIQKQTLVGINLTDMSFDTSLSIKVTGFTAGYSENGNTYTPYSMIARQVVAYQNLQFQSPKVVTSNTSTSTNTSGASSSGAAAGSTTPSTASVFTNVQLTSISETPQVDANGKTIGMIGQFSMVLTLNPAVIQLPATSVFNGSASTSTGSL